MTVSVRNAGAADGPIVVALWRACELVMENDDPLRDFDFVMASPNYELLVACNVDGIIGSIVMGHDSTRGWLSHVSVSTDARRVGIGTELVRAAEAWLTARGVTKIHLTVRAANAAVLPFYESVGYNTLPSVLMEKQLDEPSA